MSRRVLAGIAAVVLALSLSSLTYAQDGTKMEGKKEMKKEMHQGLKSVSCAPECGFKVRSHDEKELTSIVMNHAKMAHNKDLKDADVKAMMKTESPKKEK